MKIITSVTILFCAIVNLSFAEIFSKVADYPVLEISATLSPSPGVKVDHPTIISVAWDQVNKRPVKITAGVHSMANVRAKRTELAEEKARIDFAAIFSAMKKTSDSYAFPKTTEKDQLATAAKMTADNARHLRISVRYVGITLSMDLFEVEQPTNFKDGMILWELLTKELSPEQTKYIAESAPRK